MRHRNWIGTLALAVVMAQPALAQVPRGPIPKGDRTERRVDRMMDQLREEMWAYRQELDFFRRAPEYEKLVDLRYRLRGLAIRVAELERGGPRAQREQREAARAMEETARDLKNLTGRLENRTDLGAPQEVRRRADRLKQRADTIRGMIERYSDLVR